MPARRLTTSRRTSLAAAVGTALVLVLAGCATGFNAETNREYAAAVGTNARIDQQVSLLNGLFVTNPDGTATLSGTVLATARGGDTLTGVSVSGRTAEDTDAEVSLEGPIELDRDDPVRLGEEEPLVVLEGDVEPGAFLRTTLTFARAGDLTFDAIVIERTADYAEVDAPPIAVATTEPTDEPADGATDQPTDQPTP